MALDDTCPECAARTVRPDVVWFGEIPYHMEQIERSLTSAGLFVAIGTSGAVYPAAGFVMEALRAGAETLEINLERSDVAGAFHGHRIGPASETVPAWVDEMLGTG
jgi:NAD-dependent deacetylase